MISSADAATLKRAAPATPRVWELLRMRTEISAPHAQGVLEMHPRGYGFLRSTAKSFASLEGDPYVAPAMIQRYRLRQGVSIAGPLQPSRPGQAPRLAHVATIEGEDPRQFRSRNWDELTPIDPNQRIKLETGCQPISTRIMDLFAPIGKGQRGLIVAPPRTGKTILLQQIAQAVAENHPEMKLMVLLVDERPEEVTEMKRTIRGDVIASSSDRDASTHVRIAELAFERARRLAEQGQEVFMLLDSLTRLARAFNKTHGNSGKIMTGGMDSKALEIPKRMFGYARAFEEGGSLSIMGTCLVETGSRMDDLIFEEFKGTGNMELVLDRKLSEKRIYPALDMGASGTRKEEKLLGTEVVDRVSLLRRHLMQMSPQQALEALISKMNKFPTNQEFLDMMKVK